CSTVTKTASTVGTCSATITVRGTDVCLNFAEVTYSTRIDNTVPVLTGCPSDLTVQCMADVPAPANVTANDNCDGVLTPVLTETPSGTDCDKTITRTWTVADTCGNPASCTQVIHVKDDTKPTVTKGSIAACYPTVAAAEAAAKAATTVSDNCSTVTKTASTVGTCSATITVRGTDVCLNFAEVTYSTRIDNTVPVLTGCPSDLTVQCMADVPAPANVTANDNCDGVLTPVLTETPSGTDCDKTITRTWTVADTCGNPASCTQVIHVKDDTKPTVTKGSIAACYPTVAAAEAAAKAATTVSDNCSTVTKTASTVGTCSATITVRGTDVCLNFAEVTYSTRIDNTVPVLTGCPSDLTVQCMADVPAPANVTANDNCDGVLTPVLTETPSGTDCDKTITRTWTVADTCGNPASCTQVIHVKDDTKPTVTKGSIAACYPTVAAAEAAAKAATTVSDNCSTVTKTASTVGTCSATITVRGTDVCLNFAEVTYSTRIDNTVPVLTGCPSDLTVQCMADVPAPANVTANDNCDGVLTPVLTETPSGTDCDKTITRTWTVADTCGNPASCTQVIHVKDDTKPTVTKGTIAACYPTVAAAEAAALAATTASDNCSTVTKSASTVGTCSATITVTGTDECNNSSSVTYTTRIDNTAPVLSGQPATTTLTVQCLSQVPAPATVTANDNCDGVRTVTFNESATGPDCNKTITRSWSASDTCGNSAGFTQTITVHDDTPPGLTKGTIAACYPTVAAAEAAALAATTASDNCSTVTKSASTVGTCSATITVTGTDECNNSSSVTYTTRIDNTAPVLSGQPATTTLTVQCLSQVPAPATVTANDNCDGVRTVTFNESATGPDCNKTITRSWSASDTCGNSAGFTQTITVHDDTAPSINCPANISVITTNSGGTTVTYTTTANDNCGTPTVVCDHPSGSTFPIGTTTVHCT